jgi:hypothetical protein
MREEQGKKRPSSRCGQSFEPQAFPARSAHEEAVWEVVAIESTAGDPLPPGTADETEGAIRHPVTAR